MVLCKIGVAVLIFAVSDVVSGYRKYYIEDECTSSKKFQKVSFQLTPTGPDSVGELRSNRFGTYSRMGRSCLIKLEPPEGYGVLVTVLKVDFRNHNGCKDYIKIYDEDHEEEGEKLCGFQEKGLDAKTYFSKDPMDIQYRTEEGGRGFYDGFRLIFTVMRLGDLGNACQAGEFRCRNARCIWDGVTCDGINNCGDASDEQISGHPHCPHASPLAVTTIVLGIVCFVAVIIIVCLCCCRASAPDDVKKQPHPLIDDFPSRPTGGYLPLPGYNFPSTAMPMQPLHSSCISLMPTAPAECHCYTNRDCNLPQKVDVRYGGPPPYREGV